MTTTFNCIYRTDEGTESWKGRIKNIINHGNHCEFFIESRSGIHVIVGTTSMGNFACIPDWDAGCHLSDLKDAFWNEEKLRGLLGPIDGITVARALYTIADYL